MDWLRFTRLLLRPPFYYGWAMLPMAMLGVMCSAPAQTYGISVFLPYIRDDLGISPAHTATAYMLGTFLSSLPLTLIGGYMDRLGPRRVLLVVVLAYMVACFLMAQATGIISLFFAFLIIRLFGQGALMMLSSNTLAYWFSRRLGFVCGINAMGAAITISLAPRIHHTLIQSFGWRTSYMLLGLAIGAIMLPLLLFAYRNRPEEVGQQMDQRLGRTATDLSVQPLEGWAFRDAVRTRSYWIPALCVALWALIGTAVAFSTTSLFEARGLDGPEAAERVTRMFLAMGLTLFTVHIPFGYLVDRIRVHHMLCASMLMVASIGFILRMPDSQDYVWLLGISMGLSQAMSTAVSATIWVRYFGRRELGRIRGSTVTILVAGSSLGPFLVDGAASVFGGYHLVLTGMVWLPIPFAIAALFAGKPKTPGEKGHIR